MANTREEPLAGKFAITKFREVFQDCLIQPSELQWGEKLGKGAFAVVYKCRWTPVQRPGAQGAGVDNSLGSKLVAVKELKEEVLMTDDHDVKTFFGEAKILQKVKHPHVVKFVGVVQREYKGESRIGVVQEFMNMGTLNALLVKQAKNQSYKLYDEREGLKWMLQIAKGLEHLHCVKPGEISIIHRDLKPHNILLNKNPATGEVVAKLADFGLSALVQKTGLDIPLRSVSKEVQESWSNEDSLQSWGLQSVDRPYDTPKSFINSNLVTRFSLVSNLLRSRSSPQGPMEMRGCQTHRDADVLHNLSERTGSLMYMPPEVVRGDKYNESADVFSFIMVLYEVLSRVKNIYWCTTPGGNAMQQVQRWASAVSEGYRPKMREYWPDSVKSLIRDCWSGDPLKRPSISSVVARLDGILSSRAFKVPEPLPDQDIRIERRKCCCI